MASEKVEKAVETVLVKMLAKYPNFWNLVPKERRLLVAAYLTDEVKVREDGGNNRGYWVEIFQDFGGIEVGSPWCAVMQAFASYVARAPYPLRSEGYNPASVIGWLRWGTEKGYLTKSIGRGTMLLHQTTATTGHIGVAVTKIGTLVRSIEGNTGSGEGGSQRDGDGAYRRSRRTSFWGWGLLDC